MCSTVQIRWSCDCGICRHFSARVHCQIAAPFINGRVQHGGSTQACPAAAVVGASLAVSALMGWERKVDGECLSQGHKLTTVNGLVEIKTAGPSTVSDQSARPPVAQLPKLRITIQTGRGCFPLPPQ